MDVASRFLLPLSVSFAFLFPTPSGFTQEPVQTCVPCPAGPTKEPPPLSKPFQMIVDWLGQWISSSDSIQVFSGIATDPNAETSQVSSPMGHRSSTQGKRTEAAQPTTDEPLVEEPIIEAPVAPPLPPVYPFTLRSVPECGTPSHPTLHRGIPSYG